ncbi:pyrroline-5-carboxylate reductase [Gemmatimonas sp.]|uniref:pyrroline-5-carboxylate reductase n=1 Tax=Gemmatimonas sp. TaxID=1962908 RepID=UPI00391EF9E6
MKIGIIGMGKMGEAVAQGLARNRVDATMRGATRTTESATDVRDRLGIPCGTDNIEAARGADIVLLAVKPHQAERVVRGLSEAFTSDQVLLSICASITTAQLAEWSGGVPTIIRAMPNTPCLIGEGMTVFSAGAGARRDQLEAAERLFGPLGRTAVVEESLMDGVTGLSGCGPAYVYLIIEALSEAGVKIGLPRETATLLAAQTLAGASRMVLERGVHPAALKDEVTTPAGCTIDGLMALEDGKLRVTLIKGVLAATERSRSLRGA